MKKIVLALFAMLGFAGAFAQDQPDNGKAEIKFEKETHNFGTLKEGVVATYEFKFTNTGDEALVITHVNVSCGCTTPEWSKEAIPPGKTGYVRVSYDTKGRPGEFNRSITVTTNAKTPVKVLTITGVVGVSTPNVPTPPPMPPSPMQLPQHEDFNAVLEPSQW